ncbi:MAG: MATE family efflux transporter [Porcincola intestinalis]|uniref:MATE family efflux transporter n=1 Tax=Porcincola intestinalis TaxID=2606632 RepID=UPI0029D4D64C|nr:MATE family efflux transporter [Porcincola intestinalis]MCI6239002.1 MATE family efflux transporter [Lachnospiraceae bacterium]MCI6935202.1 MATE family efflux transporter [Clostridiales bacterium]MDY5331973.1 MATE family efflux transporter [Porcincola intestinalis]
MMERKMTSGTPWKQILLFSLPVFIGLLLQQLYNTVDTIIVGNYASEAALSAVGTTGSLTFLFLAVANGFSTGAGVLTSQYYGAGRYEEMRKAGGVSVSLLIIMGAVATILGLIAGRTALTYLLAVPESFRDIAVTYFLVYCLGLIFQFGYNIVAALLRSVGDSKASMYFLLIASIVNIGLDLLFVAVFKMGAAGAAIATDISQALSCIAAFIYMYRKYPVFRFGREDFRLDGEIISQIARMGFPVTLQQMIAAFGILFIQRAVNGYGQSMTASFTVGSRIELYAQMPLNSFYMALATYVGQNIGAGNLDRVRKGARQTMLLSFIVTIIIAGLILVFSEQLIRLFGISDQAAEYCRQHLKVTVMAFVLQSVYLPLFGVFQGAGDGFAITRTAAVALGIRVLTTYTLCYLPLFGYRIVWWNMMFGFIGGFIITWVHYLRGTWQNKRLFGQVASEEGIPARKEHEITGGFLS